MKKVQQFLEAYYTHMVFFISSSAVFGSLYYSEILKIAPCYLCWYQRIFMYPLFLLTGLSLIGNEKFPKKYILVLTIPGMFVAFYHYLVQSFGLFKEFLSCAPSIPCDVIDVQYFGFITLPLLSLVSFFIINLIILITLKRKTKVVEVAKEKEEV
jgi:disulfide bond formation protein DsbB